MHVCMLECAHVCRTHNTSNDIYKWGITMNTTNIRNFSAVCQAVLPIKSTSTGEKPTNV